MENNNIERPGSNRFVVNPKERLNNPSQLHVHFDEHGWTPIDNMASENNLCSDRSKRESSSLWNKLISLFKEGIIENVMIEKANAAAGAEAVKAGPEKKKEDNDYFLSQILLPVGIGAGAGIIMAVIGPVRNIITGLFSSGITRGVFYGALGAIALITANEIDNQACLLKKDACEYHKLYTALFEATKNPTGISACKNICEGNPQKKECKQCLQDDLHKRTCNRCQTEFRSKILSNPGMENPCKNICKGVTGTGETDGAERTTGRKSSYRAGGTPLHYKPSALGDNKNPVCINVNEQGKVSQDPACNCRPNCNQTKRIRYKTPKGHWTYKPIKHAGQVTDFFNKFADDAANGNLDSARASANGIINNAAKTGRILKGLENKLNKELKKKGKKPVSFKKTSSDQLAHIKAAVKKTLNDALAKQGRGLGGGLNFLSPLSGTKSAGAGGRLSGGVGVDTSKLGQYATGGGTGKGGQGDKSLFSWVKDKITGRGKGDLSSKGGDMDGDGMGGDDIEVQTDVSKNNGQWLTADIHQNPKQSIFKIVSRRYLKSAFPIFLNLNIFSKKKKNKKDSHKSDKKDPKD